MTKKRMTETRIFAFILAICIFVPILSFPSSARTLIWEGGILRLSYYSERNNAGEWNGSVEMGFRRI